MFSLSPFPFAMVCTMDSAIFLVPCRKFSSSPPHPFLRYSPSPLSSTRVCQLEFLHTLFPSFPPSSSRESGTSFSRSPERDFSVLKGHSQTTFAGIFFLFLQTSFHLPPCGWRPVPLLYPLLPHLSAGSRSIALCSPDFFFLSPS